MCFSISHAIFSRLFSGFVCVLRFMFSGVIVMHPWLWW